MPVIGVSFNSMEGSRNTKKVAKGKINVKFAPMLTEVKEVTLDGFDKKAISINFEFRTAYAPENTENPKPEDLFGHINIEGTLLQIVEDPAALIKGWEEKKELPKDVTLAVMNSIFKKCVLKTSLLADDLQLPPPMQLPMLKPKA